MAPLGDMSEAQLGYTLEHAVAAALRDKGWSVDVEPVVGSVRPDILVSRAGGQHAVIEIKMTANPIHFGAIAQVSSYARQAESVLGLSEVRPVLMAAGPVSAASRDAAENLGVEILEGERAEEPGELATLAQLWAAQLTDRWPGGQPANSVQDDAPDARQEWPEIDALDLTRPQRHALREAADRFAWGSSDLALLARAFTALTSEPTLHYRLRLASPEDWARLYEAFQSPNPSS